MVAGLDPQHPGSPAFWLRELREQYTEAGVPPYSHVAQKLDAQATFLAAYVRQAGITLACGIADRSIRTFEQWRNEDPIFAWCYARAHEAREDTLVGEARRRAVDGIEKSVRDKQGNIIGTEREYNTQLLVKLMQGLDPHKRFWNTPAANADSQSDSWRTALSKLMDRDPEALAMLDDLADKLVGEGQPSGDA